MRRRLTDHELGAQLDAWAGAPVSVRVVAAGDELIAVFRGRLAARSASKRPALFWPLERDAATAGVAEAEEPGVYLHPHLFAGAEIHTGDSVVEWRQADVVVNVRRTGS